MPPSLGNRPLQKIRLNSEASASPFDEGLVFKKIWRASPDNPAGAPYSHLATIDVADETTNHNGAAIPSPNPRHNPGQNHNLDRNVGRSSDGARSVGGAPIRSAPSVDARVTRGCRHRGNAPGADAP